LGNGRDEAPGRSATDHAGRPHHPTVIDRQILDPEGICGLAPPDLPAEAVVNHILAKA
jgi:hypothetical protein